MPAAKQVNFAEPVALNPATVQIIGGSPSQRADARKWLVKYAARTAITQVRFTKVYSPKGHNFAGRALRVGFAGTRIEIAVNVTGKMLKQVLAHEIGHAKTFYLYRGFETTSVTNTFTATFGRTGKGGNGLEAAADCAERVLTGRARTSRSGYLTHGCTARQMKLARQLVAGQRMSSSKLKPIRIFSMTTRGGEQLNPAGVYATRRVAGAGEMFTIQGQFLAPPRAAYGATVIAEDAQGLMYSLNIEHPLPGVPLNRS